MYVWSILILATTLSLTDAMRPPYWHDCYNHITNYSASASYNPETEICCLGSPNSKGNKHHKCCGSSTFDTTKKLCCDGEATDLVVGFACCGKQTHDVDKTICCKNKIVQTDDVANSECCGENVYNVENQMCCNENVKDMVNENLGCCGSETYNYETEACLYCMNEDYTGEEKIFPGVDEDESACCAGKVYNILTQDCCKMEIIDTSTHICCGEKAVERPNKNSSCCDDKLYDYTTEICCYHYTHNGTELSVITKTHPNQTECCGGKLPYDFETEVCCDEPGQEPSVLSKPEGGSDDNYYHNLCCGTVSYDNTQQLCCANKLFNVSEGQTEQCCGSELISDDKECCGDKPYDYTNDLCCSYFKDEAVGYTYNLVKDAGSIDCCGSTTYNTETELCCGDSVVKKESEDMDCCGDKMYNMKTDLCCTNDIVPKKGEHDKCCYYGQTDKKKHCPPMFYNRHEEE